MPPPLQIGYISLIPLLSYSPDRIIKSLEFVFFRDSYPKERFIWNSSPLHLARKQFTTMATLHTSVFPVGKVFSSRKEFAAKEFPVVAHLSLLSRFFGIEQSRRFAKPHLFAKPQIASPAPVTISRGLHRIGHVKGRCRCC